MAFKKSDGGKSRLDLVPPKSLNYLGYVLSRGAELYGADNWRKCKNPKRYLAALLRHVNKHQQGELLDPETNLPHLASVAINALFALELYLAGGHSEPMGGVYLAVIRRSKGSKAKRGKVIKRFRGGLDAFDRAWAFYREASKDGAKYTIKTVDKSAVVGSSVAIFV